MAAEVTDEATGVAPVAAGDGCVKGEVGNVVITLVHQEDWPSSESQTKSPLLQ